MKLPTRLLAGAAAVLFTTGTAAAATVVADTSLNVRSGPGIQYPVIAVIPDGAAVDATGCRNGWCQVDYRGHVGWASQAYLTGNVAATPYTYSYSYDEPYYAGRYYYGPLALGSGPTFAHGYYGGGHSHHHHFHRRQLTGHYSSPGVAHHQFHHFRGHGTFPHVAGDRSRFHHFTGVHPHAAMNRFHFHHPATGSFRHGMASPHARSQGIPHIGAASAPRTSAAPVAAGAVHLPGAASAGARHH